MLLSIAFSTNSIAQTIPFDSDRWEINSRESRVEDYLGHQSLYLHGGMAIVKDSEFTDGVIEFDIAFSEARGFMGAVWRVQDGKNYEEFYLRPHQSGRPDANQYTPVFNGMSGWQLYHGEGYGARVLYDYNEWMHVKIVVSGRQAEFYVKDMENPVVVTHELKRETKPGKVGLSAGNFAPAYFSNFSFKAMEQSPALKGIAKQPEAAPEGTIMIWTVSNTFSERSLENKFRLSADDKANLTWQTLNCEKTGLANLSKVQGLEQEKNTVFAKVMIVSETEQVKKMAFGYSDRINVYLNDRLIYSGNNGYRSRDFRYLGTIGYFDNVYLHLKKGENVLWLAVSESFGGWGIQAMFENLDSIKLRY
jgi:hypothetical protein